MDARTLEISKRSITELTGFIVSNSEKKGAKHYETGGLSLCKFFDGMFGSKVSTPVYNCCIHASKKSAERYIDLRETDP